MISKHAIETIVKTLLLSRGVIVLMIVGVFLIFLIFVLEYRFGLSNILYLQKTLLIDKWDKYSDQQLGYSLNYPNAWEVVACSSLEGDSDKCRYQSRNIGQDYLVYTAHPSVSFLDIAFFKFNNSKKEIINSYSNNQIFTRSPGIIINNIPFNVFRNTSRESDSGLPAKKHLVLISEVGDLVIEASIHYPEEKSTQEINSTEDLIMAVLNSLHKI